MRGHLRVGGKEEDGTGGSMTEVQRKIIGVHSRMSSSVLGWAIFQSNLTFMYHDSKAEWKRIAGDREEKDVWLEKEVRKNCALQFSICVCVCHYSTRLSLWSAEWQKEGQADLVVPRCARTNPWTGAGIQHWQDLEVNSQSCLFQFPLCQGESHYSSLASSGQLTINWAKHWWPLTYPWQWPSAEQSRCLDFLSKPPLGVTWSSVDGANGISVTPDNSTKWSL